MAVMDVEALWTTHYFFFLVNIPGNDAEMGAWQHREGGRRQHRAGCSERMAGLGPQLEVPPIGKRFVSLFCIKRRRKTHLEMFPTRRAALWRVRTTKWVVEVELEGCRVDVSTLCQRKTNMSHDTVEWQGTRVLRPSNFKLFPCNMHDPVPPLARQVLALLADIEITLLVSNKDRLMPAAHVHIETDNDVSVGKSDSSVGKATRAPICRQETRPVRAKATKRVRRHL